ncbi:MAG: zinc-ribbon domain-containing protein [Candidatus Heimdallarchaeota archaeon]|nr:zinc-ribbon domain-containing protein [Candidatus Heimdallarchaeota archaeon]
MTKQTIICSSCSTENDPTAEFCIHCGNTLTKTESPISIDLAKIQKGYLGWKMSVPYTFSVILLLTIIDFIISGNLEWSYWATIPIFLFAILAPYFSFKMGGAK